MLRKLDFENTEIIYELTYKSVKNINLRINPGGKVSVSANKKVSVKLIDNFVLSKAELIIGSLEKFKQCSDSSYGEKQYITGEKYKLLGKELTLKVIFSDKESVKSDGCFLYLATRDSDDFIKKQALINEFFKEECIEVFHDIVNRVHFMFKDFGISLPEIKIRKMKSKWGSCVPSRRIITLNSLLIEAPAVCIEYVVVHEFSHFIHPNHSKDFYEFMSKIMPDYKERKRLLESN